MLDDDFCATKMSSDLKPDVDQVNVNNEHHKKYTSVVTNWKVDERNERLSARAEPTRMRCGRETSVATELTPQE